MGEIYGWLAGALGVIVALVMAWFSGRSTGKQKQAEQTVKATKVVAERQVTASREAANVDQKVNNSTPSDVDKQLHDKWTRPGSH